jgi:hypothetical protein
VLETTMNHQSACFRPHTFSDIFRHLRLRRQLTVSQLSRLINYQESIIHAHETRTTNPSLKTLIHYVEGLGLELLITPNGITILDASSSEVIVYRWSLDCVMAA